MTCAQSLEAREKQLSVLREALAAVQAQFDATAAELQTSRDALEEARRAAAADQARLQDEVRAPHELHAARLLHPALCCA